MMMRGSQGFTLMEALVALSLFFIIVGLISFSLSQSLTYLEKARQKVKPLHEVSQILWLHKSFASTIDYYIKGEEWHPFFIGESSFVSYVSEWALIGDLPVLVVLTVEKDGQGKYSLIYYEKEVFSFKAGDLESYLKKGDFRHGRKWLLFKNLEEISFEYFGHRRDSLTAKWESRFLGKKESSLPVYIKITLKDKKEKREYLFQLKNNSNIKEIYRELY